MSQPNTLVTLVGSIIEEFECRKFSHANILYLCCLTKSSDQRIFKATDASNLVIWGNILKPGNDNFQKNDF